MSPKKCQCYQSFRTNSEGNRKTLPTTTRELFKEASFPKGQVEFAPLTQGFLVCRQAGGLVERLMGGGCERVSSLKNTSNFGIDIRLII